MIVQDYKELKYSEARKIRDTLDGLETVIFEFLEDEKFRSGDLTQLTLKEDLNLETGLNSINKSLGFLVYTEGAEVKGEQIYTNSRALHNTFDFSSVSREDYRNVVEFLEKEIKDVEEGTKHPFGDNYDPEVDYTEN